MHGYDALVIGGGPAGSTAALLLARAGWSVALVERVAFPRRKVCGEFLSATNLPLLHDLGVRSVFEELAGPEVRRAGLFAANHCITAEMPQLAGHAHGWGRAIGREHLDTMLLDRAAAEGAEIWQPWNVVALRDDGCTIVSAKTRQTTDLRARFVIAAHGSWEPGQLPTQPQRRAARGSDLFGFKAHFLNCRLPPGLMPLLAFPGGYGGMVHSDQGRVSLSCCIRRDALQRIRRAGGPSAGEAVLAHMRASCEGLRAALDGAVIEDEWRSAGPIRPGIRATRRGGIFLAGNAAGEAHPAVAEGISMAMQSGWLLAGHLLAGTERAYGSEWRRMFSIRIHAAAAIAQWAMRPLAVRTVLPLLEAFPAVLTEGARTAGKVTPICSSSF
ncbi:MAG TPA: NAD(P)/FAD-dependent oxidoreductase [Vicinamibacterales bacterium]|jgi:flavin-dependent dehydrogenase|nr:NAD(P)/FAD-dependent oxidoreductase [Vicinamibacterales bacterium]